MIRITIIIIILAQISVFLHVKILSFLEKIFSNVMKCRSEKNNKKKWRILLRVRTKIVKLGRQYKRTNFDFIAFKSVLLHHKFSFSLLFFNEIFLLI